MYTGERWIKNKRDYIYLRGLVEARNAEIFAYRDAVKRYAGRDYSFDPASAEDQRDVNLIFKHGPAKDGAGFTEGDRNAQDHLRWITKRTGIVPTKAKAFVGGDEDLGGGSGFGGMEDGLARATAQVVPQSNTSIDGVKFDDDPEALPSAATARPARFVAPEGTPTENAAPIKEGEEQNANTTPQLERRDLPPLASSFSTVPSPASASKQEIADAYAAYDDLQATLNARAASNKNNYIEMTEDELEVIVRRMLFKTQSKPIPNSIFKKYGELSGYDTFIWNSKLSGKKKFKYKGDIVEGGHINYLAVGMLFAHYFGEDYDYRLRRGVPAHNVIQILMGEGLRNLDDIEPGYDWAKFGAERYLKAFGNRPR